MNELLNLSNDPKIELVEETKKSYKIKITGDKDVRCDRIYERYEWIC